MQKVGNQYGFTIIEALVVVGIIAILLLFALPSQISRLNQTKIAETVELVEKFKVNIQLHYELTGKFPKDNDEAAMPQPDKILGNYLKRVVMLDGAMHLVLGQKLSRLEDQVLTIYPVYVKDYPASPLSWVCGYDGVPGGMKASGENKTNVKKENLPIRCR
ncbi:MAG: pilin [Arenicella sp.]